MSRVHDVPIPDRMKALARDARGYPIPFIALIDSSGVAHFSTNDTTKTYRCHYEGRCGICGQKLLAAKWFVGGPLSAFHPDGAYFDAPMHGECAEYACRVCPWIAAPNYARSIARSVMKTLQEKEGAHRVMIDPTVREERPSFFVAIRVRDYTIRQTPPLFLTFVPKRPPRGMRFFKHGQEIGVSDVTEMLAADRVLATAKLMGFPS